jgi:hypothetical protein
MLPALSSRLGAGGAAVLATAEFQRTPSTTTLAGLVTAMPLSVPAGVVIAAAALLGRPRAS